jgi:hypothetical protein
MKVKQIKSRSSAVTEHFICADRKEEGIVED